ncbi:hypothetical protein H9657_13665 [Cellulomonas sp. Sa3CUA2]|uniref:AbiEi antitoxin C-terminal domain-containing protein n=1 Tax=Cellulomonas avistercoris TaxID=2762242 RepID=A0ABR8QFW9_9CELL|nr:hypothetical protein [Cellulomonas avistercoris]MBD7919318.1 hypothetical protein [Cellulomonas avistercoris]
MANVQIAARPMRAVRPADLDGVFVNPRAVLRQRAAAGKVRRVAHGVYVAVPDDAYDPHRWRPAFEAAAGAVGTAMFGDRRAVLMGLAAARLHRVVPRARARAEMAVERRHAPVKLADREHGIVDFVRRDLDDLDVQPMRTELGTMLVTTAEQTLVDLALERTADPADVREAMRGLARKADWGKVEKIAGTRRGGKKAMATLRALRREVES